MHHKHEKDNSLILMLVISILFVVVNVILTINGLSPFALLK